MSDLPSGWARTTLSQACERVTDGTHHSPMSYPTGAFMYVTAKNVRWHGLDFNDITYVDEATHRDIYARAPVEIGDVLYIKDGATTGIAAVNERSEPFSILSSLALLKPHRELVNGYYLSYWLNSPDIRDRMVDEMGGSAIRRLTLAKIAPQLIELPPLAEQRRIVAKIDALTARSKRACEELGRTMTLLERARVSTLAELINDAKSSEALTLAQVGRWGSGGTPKSGFTSFYGGDIPWIRSGDLPDGPIRNHVVTISEAGLAGSSAKWVPAGAVLVAMYGATIGRVGLTTYPVTTNQAVASVFRTRKSRAIFCFIFCVRGGRALARPAKAERSQT